MTVTIPSVDNFSEADKLSPEQATEIQKVKDADWDAAPAADGKPPGEKPDGDPAAAPEKKEGEEDLKPEGTPEEQEAQRKAKEAETAENDRLEKRSKELGKTVEEVKQIEAADKTEQERLEKIAKEENRTVEEVKAEEAKDKSIAERHGNDPVKIARALRKEQSEYGKTKAELDSLQKFKAQVEADAAKFDEQQFEIRMDKDREKVIAKYREKFPTQADGTPSTELSDDACFERGKVIIREALKDRESKVKETLKAQAETKRTELIKNLPEEFKDFLPEVKQLLSECTDAQLADKEFDVSYLANFARGKKFTPDYVKSLVDDAYKRGVEQAKIIPKVPAARPGSGSETVPNLTEAQKTRAEDIYGRREGWTRQQMWDAYAKHDLKADSQW